MEKVTHTFKLCSGVEMEVSEWTGKHQRILTQKRKGKSHEDNLHEIMADVTVRVGSKRDITPEFIANMLDCDRKLALVETRQFTMSHEPSFTFKFEYTSDETGNKCEYIHEEDLPEGKFPSKKLQKLNEAGELVDVQYTEYNEIEKDVFITLPRSQKQVRFTMLAAASTIDRKDVSSHTPIKQRRPVYFYKAEKDTVPVGLNLDDLSYQDIEYLRKAIKDFEGACHTEIQFAHPEADMKQGKDKEVTINVLGSVAFFFPSQAL